MTSLPFPSFRRALLAAWVALAWLLSGCFAVLGWRLGIHGFDTHAYWIAWSQDLYQQDNYVIADRYLYSPVFAQVLKPLTLLPYPTFRGLWLVAMIAAFLWLAHPMRLRWRIPFLLVFCTEELVLGNVYAFMGVMVVLGSRALWPAWMFGVFTKPALGALGLVWHISRSEWRQAAKLVLASAVIAGVSFTFAPHLWVGWAQTLQAMSDQSVHLYPLRVVAALAVTVIAARVGRPWLLVPAMLLTGTAGLDWALSPLSLIVAIPRLLQPSSPASDDAAGHGRPAALPRGAQDAPAGA